MDEGRTFAQGGVDEAASTVTLNLISIKCLSSQQDISTIRINPAVRKVHSTLGHKQYQNALSGTATLKIIKAVSWSDHLWGEDSHDGVSVSETSDLDSALI
jgi:hypothetical protein